MRAKAGMSGLKTTRKVLVAPTGIVMVEPRGIGVVELPSNTWKNRLSSVSSILPFSTFLPILIMAESVSVSGAQPVF